VIGDIVLVMSLRPDLLSAYEASTGKSLWRIRVGGQSSSSPISFGGLAFIVLESGETVVVDPKSEDHIVARNKVNPAPGEIFRACLTPSDGQVFLRSDRTLYCIGKRKSDR